MSSPQGEMSFLDHIEELRWRFIKSALAVALCAIPCGIYWRRIFDLAMIYPLRMANPKPVLIYTAPAEAVVLSLKIAVAGGLICASPFVLYQIWAFIAPGLYKTEKRIVLPAVVGSTICFLMGISFCYVVLPFMVRFLATYGAGAGEPYFKASDYMSFIMKLVLAFGVVFELPVLSFVLTKMGVITPRFLVEKMRHAVVIIFVFAAILTPPDVVSQAFLAIPLCVLYGISILISFLVREKR
jgi:sec-independent protein translocase protein TatC